MISLLPRTARLGLSLLAVLASQHAAASTAITARHRRAERGRGRGESMPAS